MFKKAINNLLSTNPLWMLFGAILCFLLIDGFSLFAAAVTWIITVIVWVFIDILYQYKKSRK